MTGTILSNRYQIGAELGRGGMSVVYRGHDTLLDRDVAVKVLSNAALGADGHARLLREAQAVARLNHPNIISVYDAGDQNGTLFIVEELVEGKSLRDQPPQSLDEIVAIAEQICAALEQAHAHGIVHRDLKPENVLLTPQGTAKLMDFGLARSTASRLTGEGAIVGTVFYLAPEQALGQPLDGRADLYALGVMLYELITGHLPFTGDDPLMVISQHLHAPVVSPRTYRLDLSPALEAIVVRLLAKDREQRFASASQTAQALRESRQSTASEPAATSDTVVLLQQLARGRLVGRQSELNQLRGLWNHSQEGHGLLALISGEPGIGKTRLANEMIVYAQLNGAAVLRGGCYEYEATTPYIPLVEALREWVRGQDADELREHLGSMAAELARLAPEIEAKLGALTPNPALPANEERFRLFDNVARFLQSVTSEHGLLFFIDDLHWADQGTLSLLRYLLRHLRTDRVMFLAAYRELELDRSHPLATALVEWNRERLATRVPLGRLSLEDTGTVIATLFGQESVSQEFAQPMYRETEGNPFFIEEVIKSLIEQGQIYREDGRWRRKEISELTIPQSIKEAIGRRLNRLSETCAETLHTAAALGKVFAFQELAATAVLNEDQLLNALDEACTTQLLRVQNGEEFAFTHDKIREVLYEELNPIRRRRLHQRIGEGLERLYASDVDLHVQDLAHHFTESGDLQRGLRYTLLAADKSCRLFALEDALHYYDQARESAEALNAPDQLATVHEAIGDVYSLSGRVMLAVESYERALALATRREKRGALKAKIGSEYTQIGDVRGIDYIQSALEELDPRTQTNEMALATAMLGRFHHYRAHHARAIEYLERARQLATPQGDVQTLSSIYSYLAGVYQHLTRYTESMEWARKSIALGEQANYPLAEANGYEFLAEDSFGLGNWADVLEYAEQDRQIGEKIGAQDRVAWSGFSHANALYGLGRLQEAAEAARMTVSRGEALGDMRLTALAAGILSIAETDLGEDETARTDAELALKRGDELAQVLMQCDSRRALAYWHKQRGEWSLAEKLYDECDEILAGTDNRVARLLINTGPGEVYLSQGKLDKAEKAIDQFLAFTREARSRHWEAVGLRVQGQTRAAQARWDDATSSFEQAIAVLKSLGSQLELGRAHHHCGKMHDASGDAQAARTEWERALAIFERCGARREAEKTRLLLESSNRPQ